MRNEVEVTAFVRIIQVDGRRNSLIASSSPAALASAATALPGAARPRVLSPAARTLLFMMNGASAA